MIDTNELIEMAWSDDVTFSDIERDLGIKEPEVKRIMQANLKSSSYQLWRKEFAGSRKNKRNLERFKP